MTARTIQHPRMLEWFAISLVLFAVLFAFDAQLALRTLQKLTNVTLFGWTGYAFAKATYKMLSPKIEDSALDQRNALILGRAIIVGCAMLAGALGL